MGMWRQTCYAVHAGFTHHADRWDLALLMFSTDLDMQTEAKELGQKLLAAVEFNQSASASATSSAQPSESTGPPAAPAHTTQSTGDDSVKAELISTADRLLRELAGVPIPNMPGQIVALGSVRYPHTATALVPNALHAFVWKAPLQRDAVVASQRQMRMKEVERSHSLNNLLFVFLHSHGRRAEPEQPASRRLTAKPQTGCSCQLPVSSSVVEQLEEITCFCRLYVAPADAPMGQLDILPNTPKLWQSLAHELVRPVLAQVLRVLPVCGPTISGALQIHRLSLSVLDGHLEHVLGRKWSQGTSAVKPHINQVRVQS